MKKFRPLNLQPTQPTSTAAISTKPSPALGLARTNSTDALDAVLANIVNCATALVQQPSAEQMQIARMTPVAAKDRLINAVLCDSLGRMRRTQRHAVAAGKSETWQQTLALFSQPASVLATLSTSVFFGPAVFYGAYLVRGGPPRRTANGVREDVVLRNMQKMRRNIRSLRKAYAEGLTQKRDTVWRARISLVSARFDQLNEAIVRYPSVRLRGSPDLRGELYKISRELETLDPWRNPSIPPVNL